VIATGLVDNDKKAKEEENAGRKREGRQRRPAPQQPNFPTFNTGFLNNNSNAPQAPMMTQQPRVQSTVRTEEIQIPDFLKNRSR
jgi:hypothetical protein